MSVRCRKAVTPQPLDRVVVPAMPHLRYLALTGLSLGFFHLGENSLYCAVDCHSAKLRKSTIFNSQVR